MGAAVALAFSDPAAIHAEMLQMIPGIESGESGEVEDSSYMWWKVSMN